MQLIGAPSQYFVTDPERRTVVLENRYPDSREDSLDEGPTAILELVAKAHATEIWRRT